MDKKHKLTQKRPSDSLDRQEDSAELQDATVLEDDAPEESAGEPMSELCDDREEGGTAASCSSTGASSIIISKKDFEKLSESSQAKMGKWPLQEHEKSWDKKLKRIEQGQARMLAKKLEAMNKDIEAGLDTRLERNIQESGKMDRRDSRVN